MNVVSAKAGETLMDENGIKVTVLAIKENQVSLKVDVPDGVEVTREEVIQQLESLQGRISR